MNLVLTSCAHFCAVQVGAVVVCCGIMLLDAGPLAIPEGLSVWVLAQVVIIPIAVFTMPVGILIRMIVGRRFENAKLTALVTGSLLGAISGAVVGASMKFGGWTGIVISALVGMAAGVAGGRAWWRIEKPYLESQSQ